MSLFLIFHIIIALLSIIFTALLFLKPSIKKIYINYFLIGLTVVSGTYLIFKYSSHLTEICFTGIVYLCFVTAGMVASHHRLSKLEKMYH